MFISMLEIICAEIIVDCMKHSFVCKFNRIEVGVYSKTNYVFLSDLVPNHEDIVDVPLIDSSTKSGRRFGVPFVGLATLFLRFIGNALPYFTKEFILLALIFLYSSKFILSVTLRHYAYYAVAHSDVTNDGLIKEMKVIQRYVMNKGRIPP